MTREVLFICQEVQTWRLSGPLKFYLSPTPITIEYRIDYIPCSFVASIKLYTETISVNPWKYKCMRSQACPIWDLWWTKLHWDRFFTEYLSFSVSVSFHHYNITSMCHRRYSVSQLTAPLTKTRHFAERKSILWIHFELLVIYVLPLVIERVWDA